MPTLRSRWMGFENSSRKMLTKMLTKFKKCSNFNTFNAQQQGFNSPHLHQEKDLLFSRPFFHEIHFCATRKISSAGNICAANAKSAGCFAQRAECAVFLHAGAFFVQDIQTHCNIRPYAAVRTSQELRLIKMPPYAFLAIMLAAEQKTPSGEQSK